MRTALCSDRFVDSNINFLRVIQGHQYQAQPEKLCLIIEKRRVELVKVENGIGQWALEGVELASFIIPPMCTTWWQGYGQPRISKCPGYSFVGMELCMAHYLEMSDFTKSSSPPHSQLHPCNGCGKQNVPV